MRIGAAFLLLRPRPTTPHELEALVAVLVTTTLSSASTQTAAEPSVRVFPRASLFAPLSADPRWPRFTIGYTRYFDDSQFTHVGTAEAGASIGIVQKDNRRGSLGTNPG